jgi:hypothetical protein
MHNLHTTNTFSVLLLSIITGCLLSDTRHINYYYYYYYYYNKIRQKITIDGDKVGAPRPKQRGGKKVAEGG